MLLIIKIYHKMVKKSIRIAVVGGGIFGVTSAIRLAQNGMLVELFERNDDIFKEASGINQYRLHRGHHYPRSKETVASVLEAEPYFRQEYKGAIIDQNAHYYCISKRDSLVSGDQYLKFCKENNLEFEVRHCDVVNKDSVELCIKVSEYLLDIEKLRNICLKRLKEYGVKILFKTEATPGNLKDYDFIVVATYANQNFLHRDTAIERDYQYELCEKPVVKLPSSFDKKSIVIMDGPFMCIDPLGDTGLFVLGNVVHAIHQTNIGKYPLIDNRFKNMLNKGIITNPEITNFSKFIQSGIEFFPELKKAEHVGSMFTVRTVLPHQDKTDARPTIVSVIDHRTIAIFSGKIANCVSAADEVVGIINGKLKGVGRPNQTLLS